MEVSVVVTDGGTEMRRVTLAALARQHLAGRRGEVILVDTWPRSEPVDATEAGELEGRRVEVAVQCSTAAANAAFAAARGDVVVNLPAGEITDDELLLRHVETIEAGAAAVVAGGGSADTWVGPWPRGVPPFPLAHFAIAGDALRGAGGLDERLPEIEVAAAELLSRIAGAGALIVERRELRAGAGAPAADQPALGRSGRALAELLAAHGVPTVSLGPRRARVTLRWGELGLRAATSAGLGGERVRRLADRAAFARGAGRYPPALAATARGGLIPAHSDAERPSVAVVVPFAGRREDAESLLDFLGELRRRPGDEVIVVDNSRAPVVEARPGMTVVRADGEWSSYHARNVGWRAASASWLLFVDSDCRPCPWVIDAYFSPPPAADEGAVAGGIHGAPPSGWAGRWSEGTEVLSQARSLGRPEHPYAVTANLLVRREALEDLGGFAEGVRSGGDTDLSWRLLSGGWKIGHRPRAAVIHFHRTTMRGLVRQYRRYGGGSAWLGRRYPGALSGWPSFPRTMITAPVRDLAAGRFESALMRVTDLLITGAAWVGAREPNRPESPAGAGACGRVGLAGAFPDADGTELPDGWRGPGIAVEARRRPRRFATLPSRTEVAYAEDDAFLDRIAALRWLARQPGGRGTILTTASEGRGPLTALAADAAVARRVAARGAHALVRLDDDPDASAALLRVRDLLGLPATGDAVEAAR